MTEEQRTYIETWIAKHIHIKEDRWIDKDLMRLYYLLTLASVTLFAHDS